MIVLDTNVVSEVLRAAPSAKVMSWLRSEPIEALFTTTITEGELFFGVALLDAGRRRDTLTAAIIRILDERFAGRILPFDSVAAREFADITANRQRAGRKIAEADARIAAIARSRGASIATRNTKDFTDCGVVLVDPWR